MRIVSNAMLIISGVYLALGLIYLRFWLAERERLAYLREAERSAAEAVQLARQRYRDGIADYLSVLDAERTLLDLQERLTTAQTLSATRLIAVYKSFASGGALAR